MPRKTASIPTAARRVSLKMLAEHPGPQSGHRLLRIEQRARPFDSAQQREKESRPRQRSSAINPASSRGSLQGLKTQTIGILLPELGEGYHSLVLSGAADVLMQEGYFFFTAHHRHRKGPGRRISPALAGTRR